MTKGWLQQNLFTLGLVAVVLLAMLIPQWGAADGPLRTAVTTKWGIMLIFLLQGLTLPTRELAGGIRQGRLHLFIQLWTYAGVPILLLPAWGILRMADQAALAGGIIYLALLPTTISSAVAFTTTAGGNVAASIFSTTLSNLIGVFWVPLACLLLFAASGENALHLLGPLLWQIAQLILLPLLVGQLIRPLMATLPRFIRAKRHFKTINNAIILFIVFAAFSQSMLNRSWDGVAAWTLLLLVGLVFASAILIHGAIWLSSGWIVAQPADRICALFCGGQKTLAAGIPMAMAIFAGAALTGGADLGLLLLPLMLYHPTQLFLAAWLVPYLQKQTHPMS